MPRWWREGLVCVAVIALAGVIWLPSLGWGLPSRDSDRALFGDRTPWTGAQIIALTTPPRRAASISLAPEYGGEGTRGADVDADPILDRSKPVVLNDTDAKRAEIVRRYRLMSGQPDEFIQFKALAEMSQRAGLSKLDPRLYQYGGLWIYPVGGLIRTAMAVGLIERPTAGVPALEFYLDHPEAFGRFYVVARAYSAFWGFVALAAIYVLARRPSGGRFAWAALACVLFMSLPVVRTATHEAKPHLAGAALCLWSVIAAARYVERGRRRWLIISGVLCGAAMAMVISMLISLVVLPAAWWMRRRNENPLARPRGRGQDEGVVAGDVDVACIPQAITPSPQPSPPTTGERGSEVFTLVASVLCAALVYAATDPFVLINAIAHRELLRSNLGNSTAMYGVGGILGSLSSANRIAQRCVGGLLYGVTCVVAMTCLIAIATPRYRKCLLIARPAGLRLAYWLGVDFAALFIAFAAGKPAEFGRFGIVSFAVGCVAFAGFLSAVRFLKVPLLAAIALLAILTIPQSFRRSGHLPDNVVLTWPDGRPNFNPYIDDLRTLRMPARFQIGVLHEPAPWSMPPIDLFRFRLLLVRPEPSQLRQIDLLIWPANLDVEVSRGRLILDSPDWRENRFLDLEPDRTHLGHEWWRLD